MKISVQIVPVIGNWKTFSSHKLLIESIGDYFYKKLVPGSNYHYYNFSADSSIWSCEHEDYDFWLSLGYIDSSIAEFVVQLAVVEAEECQDFKNFLDTLCAEYRLVMESITESHFVQRWGQSG